MYFFFNFHINSCYTKIFLNEKIDFEHIDKNIQHLGSPKVFLSCFCLLSLILCLPWQGGEKRQIRMEVGHVCQPLGMGVVNIIFKMSASLIRWKKNFFYWPYNMGSRKNLGICWRHCSLNSIINCFNNCHCNDVQTISFFGQFLRIL